MSQASFYKVGGNLSFQHPSYVKRQADEELEQELKAGEFCYVFNSRQMGKSSLGIQIMQRLKVDGYACCFISLAKIGSEATIDEWYFTLTDEIARKLRISCDVTTWWNQQHTLLNPLGRFSLFIEIVLLKKIEQNIVIFIDEIDSVRRLKFSADDFFGWIRDGYNNRAEQAEYKRLTFAFLGVATPSDLIQKENCTPFNIGKGIYLKGFKLHEALPLAKGLQKKSSHPEAVLKEILFWTGGQPFLTQKLCKLVAESTEVISSENQATLIERITQEKIIKNWEIQDNPAHLRTIRDRLLRNNQLIRRLLGIYQQILQKGEIPSDNSPEQWELQLSGLVVNQEGTLKIYNPIYAQVFNEDWLKGKLNKLCPYSEAIFAWKTSNFTDCSYLLRGQALKEAWQWSKDQNLNTIDHQYLSASKELEYNRKFKSILLILGSFLLGTIVSGSWVHQEIYKKYASCPLEKGIVGEKIEDICFRSLISSGERKIFLSNTNFHLEEGIKFFKKEEYQSAIKLFEQAIDADRTDPVPQIFLNNAKAYQTGKPLTLVVVAGIDFYEGAAKDILRGVADAQTKFNDSGGKNGRLLEIVIVNDGNDKKVAKRVAETLSKRENILGIIGHHASGSSKAALPIYKEKGLAVVSPTSASSELENDVFFRTVKSTKLSATEYAEYIKNNLNSDNSIVFYEKDDNYSKNFKKDFENAFTKLGGKVTKDIDFGKSELNINEEIEKAVKNNIKVALLFPGVKTKSVASAIARENSTLKPTQKLQLLGGLALSEKNTIEKGGAALEGLIFSHPCLTGKSDYMEEATDRWQQEVSWRVGTSYDATQAFIEAIRLSKKPNREEILDNLKSLELPEDKTSGFGPINWSEDRSNPQRKYCFFEIGKLKDYTYQLKPLP